MTNACVLVIDDEPDILELISLTLARMNVDSVCVDNIAAAKRILSQRGFFLVLADMYLPDGDGLELVEHIQEHYAQTPVAVITAHGNVENAVQTLKAGAFDYVAKPIDINMLRNLVSTAENLSGLIEQETDQQDLIGNATVIENLRQKINKLSRSQAPVFINGESGTGKELVAKLIHQQGPRAQQPFIAVNCGAIPSELMESEFFGHKKGSFTGATADREGFFQAAHGGTLFLDEVADLPLPMQVKLLRAVQEKAIRPIGEANEVSVDVRILSASHKDLNALVQQGSFRQDLFYRINVIELCVPSLRQRMEDLPQLATHILKKISHRHGLQSIPTLDDSALRALAQYNFPGNVRELENILERAATLCENNCIGVADCQLPEFLSTAATTPQDLDATVGDQEKQIILAALEEHKWNRTQTAKALGLSFRQLRYRLKKWHIE